MSNPSQFMDRNTLVFTGASIFVVLLWVVSCFICYEHGKTMGMVELNHHLSEQAWK